MGEVQSALIGEFDRGDYVFAVLRDGEVHRVDARQGDSAAIVVCHIYNRFTSPNWLSGWFLDSWRPWIEFHARRIIAEVEPLEDDRVPFTPPQPDHIPQ